MIYVNGQALAVTQFPDKTSQVWHLPSGPIDPSCNFVHVKWEYSSEAEIMHLAQLKALLDSLNIKSALRIMYLPYARQDKEVSNDATFALRPFASILNSLNFQEVILVDPHSEIALELINSSRAVYPADEIKKVVELTSSELFCYPDKGARTKYSKVYTQTFIYGEKVRDQSTGFITSYELVGDPKGKRILIIDDICDGGATFILLAKELLSAGAVEVNLFVSHGIFSKGLKPIFESGIKRVFTKDGEAGEYQNQITYRRL